MIKKTKILVVDDDKIIRDTLSKILKEEKYIPISKGTSKSALDIVKKMNFNIAIVDLKLPDSDGLTLLKEIKENIPDICGIVITAYPETDTAISALQKQAYDYIAKPFDIGHIKATIKKCIEKQIIERENKYLLEKLSNEKEKLTKIMKIGKKMSLMHNVKDISNFLIKKACELLKAEKGSLMLIENEKLFIAASVGLEKKIVKNTIVDLGKDIAGWVAKYGKPLFVKDIKNDLRIKPTRKGNYKSQSFISLPIKRQEKVIGVINLTDKIEEDKIFNNTEIKYLSVLMNEVSVVIENAKLCERLNNESITDPLTVAYNYRYFNDSLQKEIKYALRHSSAFSLIMTDVDNFKYYNDTYGHLMGDEALKTIADILKKNTRASDVVCRYGGDEFIIILPNTNSTLAMNVAEKLRKAVKLHNFPTQKLKGKINLTLSLGISMYKNEDTDKELIKRVDKALYKSKNSNKNTSTFYL